MKNKSYKFRFYPTPEQEHNLARTFGAVRFIYNKALFIKSNAWRENQERISYNQMSSMLTEWKKTDEMSWLNDISCVPTQNALRNLQTAYDKFWRKQAEFPRFKKKRSKNSATYFKSSFSFKNGQLKLAKHKQPLDIRWDRSFNSTPSQVTVSRDSSGRFFVSMLVEEDIQKLEPLDNAIGLDAGISSLYTLSDGTKIENPKHFNKEKGRLAKAQRKASKKKLGSKNRAKANQKVAKIHAKIADRRKDHLHKLSTKLIRENQTICIEDLSVRDMLESKKMSLAISDASWYEFRRQLEYKADWYGREIIAIDRFYPSSKTCSDCGYVIDKLPLNIRSWICPCCSVEHDRDLNAALNILAVGLAVSVCGDGIRPSVKQKSTIREN